MTFWDVMPTVAALIGYPSDFETDGLSFKPVLLGNPDAADKHHYLYWDYGHVRETFMQGVRYDDHKGIAFHKDGKVFFELYDLRNDPGEKDNIAAKNPGLAKKMEELMREAYDFNENYPRKATFD